MALYNGSSGRIFDKGLSAVAGFIFIFILVFNNLLYQTDFQINQVLLVLLLLIFIALVRVQAENKLFFYWLLPFFLLYFFSIVFSEKSGEVNRGLFFFSAVILFLLVYYRGYMVRVSSRWLIFYFICFLIVAVVILVTSDRIFINPNWLAATLYFMLALAQPRSRVLFFSILFSGLAITFFIYESRGSTVMFLVAYAAIVSQFLFGDALARKLYLFVYFSLVIVFFLFLHYLSENSDSVMSVIKAVSERGLGGREFALIKGYVDLSSSYFLGNGPASSGGYINPEGNQPIHIHFGLLDIALKFSALGALFVIFLIRRIVMNVDAALFPMLAGALMSVFFYNGLALSHFGLNVFMMLVVSKAAHYKRAGYLH